VISAVQMAAVLFQAKMIIGLNEMIVSYSQCFHVCKIKSSVLCCNGDSFYWNTQTCKKGGDLEICCSVLRGVCGVFILTEYVSISKYCPNGQ